MKHTTYKVVMVISLLVYLYYLVYRLLYTLNPQAPIVSGLFYLAEVHGFIALFLYYFQLWDIRKTTPPPPKDHSVDVFITTYNEDLDLLRRTVLGCLGIRYPHRTYILDDGNRKEVEGLAKELGCGYISREDNKDGKAGNLNNALSKTDGEFVATFDADHVPRPDFLDKTMGYFEDERVALVQTPQHFYNIDSFQYSVDYKKRRIWNEQEVFFELVQPGKNHWNAAFFCGTGAVLRRKALDEIGGITTGTATEDMHTSLRLQAKGWKTIYHHEPLVTGLAAVDLKSYHTQRLRWAEGNLRILRYDNPLFMKGLTLAQRICYWASIFHWFTGFPKLIFYLTPPIMLLFSKYPIKEFNLDFFIRYLIYMVVTIISFKIVSRGSGQVLKEELYNMANFAVLIKAFFINLFRWREHRFMVTQKHGTRKEFFTETTPHLIFIAISLAAILWGFLKLYYGISKEYIWIGIGIFWCTYNAGLAFGVIRTASKIRQQRWEYRLREYFPVYYRPFHDGGKEGIGITSDFHEVGISLICYQPLRLNDELKLRLILGEHQIEAEGEVLFIVKKSKVGKGVYRYGIKLRGVSREDRDYISSFFFHYSIPKFFHYFERYSRVKRAFLWFSQKRRWRRKGIRLPLLYRLANTTSKPWCSVSEDLSQRGLSFYTSLVFDIGNRLDLTLLTPLGELPLQGTIVRRREKTFGVSKVYLYGINFEWLNLDSLKILEELLGRKETEFS